MNQMGVVFGVGCLVQINHTSDDQTISHNHAHDDCFSDDVPVIASAHGLAIRAERLQAAMCICACDCKGP